MPIPLAVGAALSAILPYLGRLAAKGGVKALTKLASKKAGQQLAKGVSKAAGKGLGMLTGLYSKGGAASKAAQAAGLELVPKQVSSTASRIPDFIINLGLKYGLKDLSQVGSQRFINYALASFLRQFPQALQRYGGADSGLGQLLLEYKPESFTLGNGGNVFSDPSTLQGGKIGPGGPRGPGGGGWFMYPGGGNEIGPYKGGLPNAAGDVLSSLFGAGGGASSSGGVSLDDLLNGFFENPGAYWQQQVNGNPAQLGVDDPFMEERARGNFRRAEHQKNAELNRKLDEINQEWVDEKLRRYYHKPMRQWLQEKALEAAGTAAGAVGNAYDIYSSILANSLINAAAATVTPEQQQAYGNVLMPGTQLYAGARQAAGAVTGLFGREMGDFLKNWSEDVAGEFEKQRALRMQLDMRPSGLAMESYYKLGKRRPGTANPTNKNTRD